MQTLKVSDFIGQKVPISKKDIDTEYDVLEQLYDQDVVIQNLLTDEKRIYSDRNRYSDILTYRKSRVKLQRGVYLQDYPDSDYINACYVNSPFENAENKSLGDKKIIASQGPLP
jgi:protein tyrosine phosphatase